jgi:hypothetical protein
MEGIWRLASPYTAPVGVAVYVEPTVGRNLRELESKLILQKNFLDDKLVFAANLTLAQEGRYLPADPEAIRLKLHGAGAFLALLALGSLLAQHIRFGWSARRNRTSGSLLGGFAALIVLTGYGLYYAGEDLREWSKWTHLALGTLAFIAPPLHVWLGRRTRQRRGVPQGPRQ